MGNSAVLLKAIAAKTLKFYLQDYAGMNCTTAKDYGRQITQQQIRAYLQTKTGQKGKMIASLGLVWQGTVLQMKGYLIIFEFFFHRMVAKGLCQLAHQVYNRHTPVNEGNVTHSSLKEKLGLTNFSAWQIKIKWQYPADL